MSEGMKKYTMEEIESIKGLFGKFFDEYLPAQEKKKPEPPKEEKPADYVLHTLVCPYEDDLIVGFWADEMIHPLGYVTFEGELLALHYDSNKDHRKIWLENGGEKDCGMVKWHGNQYWINHDSVLTSLTKDGSFADIYSFRTCQPFTNCKDENIKRYEDNNTPILF